jgi:hypothetical protein
VLQDIQRAVGGMVVRGPDAPIGVGLGGYGIELAGEEALALVGAKKNCHMG